MESCTPPDDVQLVLVTWKDANTDNEPVTLETVQSAHKAMIVHTLGWLLYEDEEGVTIVNEFYSDSYRGRTFILKSMLVSVVPYKLSKPRVKKIAAA